MRWFERPFPGSDRKQHWFMLRTERQLEQFGQEPWAALRARAFLADRIPPDIDPGSVKALCIEDHFHLDTQCADVPASVHRFRSLEFLRLPKRYIPQLRQDSIPDTVRVLDTIGDGPATFPEGITLPNVVRLIGGNAALKFTPKTFPCLSHLELRLDGKRTMLGVLRDLSQLQTLSIGPNRDTEIFGAVGAKALTVLNLAGGAIETLAGIERLRSLRAVGLRSLDKLKDIGALARLPKLKGVMITWCAKLSAFDPLLQLASLEYLDIFGCKGFRAEEYGPALADKNLRELRLPPG
jgi:hypothetical protein